MRAKAARGKEREAADDQEEYSTRHVADPHYPRERPACQKFGYGARCCALIHDSACSLLIVRSCAARRSRM